MECIVDEIDGFFCVRKDVEADSFAILKRRDHAERLCSLFKDTTLELLGDSEYYKDESEVANRRIAEVLELFRRQEELTWFDFGYDPDEEEIIKRFLSK